MTKFEILEMLSDFDDNANVHFYNGYKDEVKLERITEIQTIYANNVYVKDRSIHVIFELPTDKRK